MNTFFVFLQNECHDLLKLAHVVILSTNHLHMSLLQNTHKLSAFTVVLKMIIKQTNLEVVICSSQLEALATKPLEVTFNSQHVKYQ